jgi:hypothetical protein
VINYEGKVLVIIGRNSGFRSIEKALPAGCRGTYV